MAARFMHAFAKNPSYTIILMILLCQCPCHDSLHLLANVPCQDSKDDGVLGAMMMLSFSMSRFSFVSYGILVNGQWTMTNSYILAHDGFSFWRTILVLLDFGGVARTPAEIPIATIQKLLILASPQYKVIGHNVMCIMVLYGALWYLDKVGASFVSHQQSSPCHSIIHLEPSHLGQC